MRELTSQSVDVWDSDPETYSYHPVGYIQAAPEKMHSNVASIAQQQQEINYESVFIEGEKECSDYMKGIFSDWQAKNITTVLHEKRGGYANNLPSMKGLATKAENEGVRIYTGFKVTGIQSHDTGNSIKAVETDNGIISCDYLVIGVGPWIKNIWEMLELPKNITVKGVDGTEYNNVPMWVFWSLQEGTLGIDTEIQKTNSGEFSPVIHVDTDAPLNSRVMIASWAKLQCYKKEMANGRKLK